MSDFIKVCEEAARAAGAVLMDWRGRFQAQQKGPADLVTEADVAAQKRVEEILLGRFPDHSFLGEESAPTDTGSQDGAGSKYRWIVDPLDGTTNYVHGLTGYCVSIALEHGNELICATIYDPVTNECYTAEAGDSAYLNGQKLSTSNVSDMCDALVCISFPPRCARDSPQVSQLMMALEHAQAFRRMGSAALNLAYLAAGRVDAYWSSSTKAWDMAAGALLVQEAGGVITAPDGGPLSVDTGHFVAAANEKLHDEVMRLLGEAAA